jgi:hypothetical protein
MILKVINGKKEHEVKRTILVKLLIVVPLNLNLKSILTILIMLDNNRVMYY